jgi:hypothetical protein
MSTHDRPYLSVRAPGEFRAFGHGRSRSASVVCTPLNSEWWRHPHIPDADGQVPALAMRVLSDFDNPIGCRVAYLRPSEVRDLADDLARWADAALSLPDLSGVEGAPAEGDE